MMTNKMATLTALAALALSPAVALAQSPTSPTTTTPPAATDSGMTQTPATTTAPADKMAPAVKTTVAPTTPKFVKAQAAGQLLGSKVIGTDVVTPNDEKLGDISDILMDKNGQAVAAVIDVGGFLGIGAKPVAVSFDSLTMAPSDDGTKIVVALTKEELNNAPEFKTLEESRSASSAPTQ